MTLLRGAKVSSVSDTFFRNQHLSRDIKRRSIQSGTATILGQMTRFVIQIGSTMILARILTPAHFGLVAMVTAIVHFANFFKDLGLSMATVQKSEISHHQVSTLFWINVAVSVMIAALTAALAPAIAWFYDEPRLTMITISFSIVFVFGGFTVQHQALLERQMRFRTLASIQVLSVLGGAIFAVISALLGAGYWALVIMQGSSALGVASGVWLACNWRPGLPVRNAGVKGMLLFGGNITGFNLVNYFARNADNILIGRFWGATSLGYYSKAYELLMLPIRQINMPISAVAIPTLSRLRDDPVRYEAYYLRALSLITFVTTPLVAFLTVCSEDIIVLLLGSNWRPSGRIFSVLGFSALIQPLYFTQGWLHISAGRSDRYLRWGFISSFCIVMAFVAGLPYGALGVAIAYSVVTWGLVGPGMCYAGRSAGISLKSILLVVYKNLLAGLISIAVCFLLLQSSILPESSYKTIAVGALSIVLSYNLCILILFMNFSPWHQILDVVRTLVQKKGSS